MEVLYFDKTLGVFIGPVLILYQTKSLTLLFITRLTLLLHQGKRI